MYPKNMPQYSISTKIGLSIMSLKKSCSIVCGLKMIHSILSNQIYILPCGLCGQKCDLK